MIMQFQIKILMYKNQFEEIDQKEDLLKVLNLSEDLKSPMHQSIKHLLDLRVGQLQQEIGRGDLTVFDRNRITEELKLIHQERVKKEKELQSPQIQSNEHFLKQLKKEIIKLKHSEVMLAKEGDKLKKKQIAEHIKKWEQTQIEIRQKKQVAEAQRNKQQIQYQQQLAKQEKQRERQRRAHKKKNIQKKMKQIDKNRIKRQQILKFSEIELNKLHPKFLQIEKKYKQLEEELKFEEDLYKKNHKLSTRIDYEMIKAHQRNYMEKVGQRNQKLREAMKSSSIGQRKNEFTSYVYRDEGKVEEERNKFKRRLQFEKQLKKVNIDINPQKRKIIEIQIDRAKNPLKYNFLSQKSLSKEQIYEQFPDFQVNLDPRLLGKEYLRELPNITENSRIRKSSSEHTLSSKDPSERVKYKDYLNDLKASRPPRSQINEEEFRKSNLDEPSKRRLLQKLAIREKQFGNELMKKQGELQQYNGLKSSLKKVKEMDQIYSRSIQAKLKMLQIKQ